MKAWKWFLAAVIPLSLGGCLESLRPNPDISAIEENIKGTADAVAKAAGCNPPIEMGLGRGGSSEGPTPFTVHEVRFKLSPFYPVPPGDDMKRFVGAIQAVDAVMETRGFVHHPYGGAMISGGSGARVVGTLHIRQDGPDRFSGCDVDLGTDGPDPMASLVYHLATDDRAQALVVLRLDRKTRRIDGHFLGQAALDSRPARPVQNPSKLSFRYVPRNP